MEMGPGPGPGPEGDGQRMFSARGPTRPRFLPPMNRGRGYREFGGSGPGWNGPRMSGNRERPQIVDTWFTNNEALKSRSDLG